MIYLDPISVTQGDPFTTNIAWVPEDGSTNMVGWSGIVRVVKSTFGDLIGEWPVDVSVAGTITVAFPDTSFFPSLARIGSFVTAMYEITITGPSGAVEILQGPVAVSGRVIGTATSGHCYVTGDPLADVEAARQAAVSTAADRVQTGLDRAQTEADAEATAADRVQTAADRVQASADRVQTTADAAATAIDADAVAADRVAAEAARDGAVAARDAALVNGGLVYATRAELFADLTPAANASAWVVADGTQSYLGIYRKTGGSGSGSWAKVAPLPLDARVGIYWSMGQKITVNWTGKTVVTSAGSGIIMWNGSAVAVGASQSVSWTGSNPIFAKWVYADLVTGVVGVAEAPAIPPLNSVVIAYIYNRRVYSTAPGAAIAYVDDLAVSHWDYDAEQNVPVGIYYAVQTCTIDMQIGTITTDGVAGIASWAGNYVTVPAAQSVSISTASPTFLRWVVVDKITGALNVIRITSGAPNGGSQIIIAVIYAERLYPLHSSAGNIIYINSSGAASSGGGQDFSQTVHRLLLPPTLHLFSDLPRRMPKSSILSAYDPTVFAGMACNLRTMKTTDIDPDRGFDRDIVLTASELASIVEIGFRHELRPDKRYIKSMGIATAPALTGKSIKVLQIGDSLGEDGMMTEIRNALLAKGAAAVTAVGTYQSAATDGLYGEARGFWNYRKFIGKDNLTTGQGAHTRSTTGATSTKFQNPFLKLADAGDKTAHPDWCFRFTGALNEHSYVTDPSPGTGDFYIFDFAWYLSAHGLASPDVIVIALERNDLDLDRNVYTTDAARLAQMRLGLNVMLTQIRVWDADVPIVVVPAYARSATAAGNTRWAGETAAWIENCITDIGARADANIHVCGAWATMSREWVFPYSATAAVSAVNTEQVKTITDTVHPDAATSPYYGVRQAAYSLAATIACAVP